MEIQQEQETEPRPQTEDTQKIKRDAENTQQLHVNELPLDPNATLNSLYEDHKIKEEMVMGPTGFYNPTNEYTSQHVMSSEKRPSENQSNESDKENESPFSNYYNNSAKDSKRKSKNNQEKNAQEKAAFTCDYCQEGFDGKQHLIKHIKQHMQIFQYICTFCKRQYENKVQFEKHVKLHTVKKSKIKCKFCEKYFASNRTYNRHFKKFHSGSIKCNQCKESFGKNSYYNHKCKSPYVCVCGKTYFDLSNYIRHKKGYCHILSKNEKINCSICNKNFQNQIRFGEHLRRSHDKISKYICDFCNKIYKHKAYLTQHLSKHMKMPQLYPCEICNKNFYYLTKLNTHLFSHTGKSSFTCRYCDKSFSSLFKLNSHEIYHTDKKAFTCSKCNLLFKSRQQCQIHEKDCFIKNRASINDENELTCKICYKIYGTLQSFSIHWRKSHAKNSEGGDKTEFKCEICFKYFTLKHNLERHVKNIHSGNKDTHFCNERQATSRGTLVQPLNEKDTAEEQRHEPIKENDSTSTITTKTKNQEKNASFETRHRGDKTDFKCKICFTYFTQKYNLDAHVRKFHTGNKNIYFCNQRQATSKGPAEEQRHEPIKENDSTSTIASKTKNQEKNASFEAKHRDDETDFRCKVCFNYFATKYNLERHVKKVHSGNKNYFRNERQAIFDMKCNICLENFTDKYIMERHVKESHIGIKNTYTCNKCNVTFERNKYYNHTCINHVCVCGKYFSNQANYNSHKRGYCRILSNHNSSKCTVCNKIFPNKMKLYRHLKIHNKTLKNKPKICDFCYKSYQNKRSLVRHLSHHMKMPRINNDTSALNPCEICGKKLSNIYTLNQHLMIHTDKRPFQCSKCKLSFRKQWSCKIHEKDCKINSRASVNDKNELICKICHTIHNLKSFTWHWKMNHAMDNSRKPAPKPAPKPKSQHKSKDYTYICDFCGKTYGHKKSLIQNLCHHMKMPQLYPCKTCTKNFSSQSKLKKHLISHSDKRPFKCNKCEMAFKSQSSLKRHEKDCIINIRSFIKANEDNKLACKICNKTFSLNGTFFRHWRKFHA